MISKNLISLTTTFVALSTTPFLNHSFTQAIAANPQNILHRSSARRRTVKISKQNYPSVASNKYSAKLNNKQGYEHEFRSISRLPSSLNNQPAVLLPREQPRLKLAQSVTSGKASWYGPGFDGRLTANGEIYNQNGLTAAHRSLPFGTKVRVTNVNNGRSVVVRINDRGPFVGGRVIDLSAGAARTLGMVNTGVAPVKLEILGR